MLPRPLQPDAGEMAWVQAGRRFSPQADRALQSAVKPQGTAIVSIHSNPEKADSQPFSVVFLRFQRALDVLAGVSFRPIGVAATAFLAVRN